MNGPQCIWLLMTCAAVGVISAQPTFLPGEDPRPAGKVWKQVALLSDEFDGNTLDHTKWQDDPTANGWSWYGRAPGLFRTENVKLKDGRMCVTVSKLDAPIVRGSKTFTHQGAIVRSLHPGQPGWYFECRMKANATIMSSTFWLITKPSGGKGGLELDIQECIGLVTEKTEPWAKKWDRIFHSNLIHWTRPKKIQLQGSIPTPTKNSERFYVYGAWWKSPEEVRFYLDGKYVYSIKPKVAWDVPAFIQMAIETYDWNPVPEDGGLVETGTWEQRTTQYDWVRTWELVDGPALAADTPAAQPYLAHTDSAKQWVLDPRFSDEFNAPEVDDAKWDRKMAPWGDRAWTAHNVYQRAGTLFIRATYEPHTTKGNKYFYKLGILRSNAMTTYGYFEARVKGCSKFPGLCPAFWLYSYGKAAPDLNPKYSKITYSEIDIFEIQQGLWHPEFKRAVGPNYIDLNLHTRIINAEGKEIWQRPNSLPDVCRHGWEAPWNPAHDYHIYGCENTPEKITWFIDGKPVAEAKNLYWHLPMSVTFTMELRPPLIKWAGEEGRLPVSEASTPDGFPTEMLVDYVRVWNRK